MPRILLTAGPVRSSGTPLKPYLFLLPILASEKAVSAPVADYRAERNLARASESLVAFDVSRRGRLLFHSHLARIMRQG